MHIFPEKVSLRNEVIEQASAGCRTTELVCNDQGRHQKFSSCNCVDRPYHLSFYALTMTNYGSDSTDRMEEQSVTSRLLANENESVEIADISRVKSRWPAAVLSFTSLVCIVVMSVFLLDGGNVNKTFDGQSENTLQLSRGFTVRATNEYGYYDGSNYPWMSEISGTQLVEPYKSTLLTLNGLEADDEFVYSWTIVNENGLNSTKDFVNQNESSNTLSLVFQNAGIYALNVLLANTTGYVKYSYSTRLVCK